MTDTLLFWFRRDLRLDDHPGLTKALQSGKPVIPVFILDPETSELGAAHLWRLEASLTAFDSDLKALGSRLVVRKGDALDALKALASETGATEMLWSRAYDPTSIERDKRVKSGLNDAGLAAASVAGHILFEPWTVKTGQGGFYKVYTPFWKAVRGLDVGQMLPVPTSLNPPQIWPESLSIADLGLAHSMQRGGSILERFVQSGERAALNKLTEFLDGPVAEYNADRDRLDRKGTSGLSAHLALGEVSARRCYLAARNALDAGVAGAEVFAKELVWRDFAYHLIWNTPHITTTNWRDSWDAFPWRGKSEAFLAWCQGRTGEPVIDAAMREMYVTGTMHNRARMLVASYLTKHLLTDWRLGMKWFADCLVDWDPASNAMGWQWAAGSGPDAAPYFRVFNPATQAEKFDPQRIYRDRWIAEGKGNPSVEALAYFEAIPKAWNLSPSDPYPTPIVDLKKGREAALAAYKTHSLQIKGQVA